MGASSFYVNKKEEAPTFSITASTLEVLKEHNKLTVFSASFASISSSKINDYGLTAEKTLISSSSIDYFIDMSDIQQSDVKWDKSSKTLTIFLPKIQISNPILSKAKYYDNGSFLLSISDYEQRLDKRNTKESIKDILDQAKAKPIINLAERSAKKSIKNNFSLPFRAMGIYSNIIVEFEHENNSM